MSQYLGLVFADDGITHTVHHSVVEAKDGLEAEQKILALYYTYPGAPINPRMIYRSRIYKLDGEGFDVPGDRLCSSLASFLSQETKSIQADQDRYDWGEYQRLKKIFEPQT